MNTPPSSGPSPIGNDDVDVAKKRLRSLARFGAAFALLAANAVPRTILAQSVTVMGFVAAPLLAYVAWRRALREGQPTRACVRRAARVFVTFAAAGVVGLFLMGQPG